MTKPIGYFGGDYGNSAIKQFSAQFEQQNGDCALSQNDQCALVAVLAVHAWGLTSGLEDNFWTNVDSAIGDGVETSLETEDESAPMQQALNSLQALSDPMQCYALISWLAQ